MKSKSRFLKNQIHDLKILPEFYQAVINGTKTFELRKDDRGFAVGDILLLREWEHEYTGRQTQKVVKYILKNCIFDGLMPGYVIMAI